MAARPHGQHSLRSARVAAELVELAKAAPGDIVFEIGAGAGRLTEALAATGCSVIAVELDPVLVERLRRRLPTTVHVTVVEADILAVSFPTAPFCAFGNLPFDLTTAMLSLGWAPWELSLLRRLPAACFEPPPRVDAAFLLIARREPALLDPAAARSFRRLLRLAFSHSSNPVGRSLRPVVSPLAWKRFGRERGIPVDARPRELDVYDWADVFRLIRGDAEQLHRPEPPCGE